LFASVKSPAAASAYKGSQVLNNSSAPWCRRPLFRDKANFNPRRQTQVAREKQNPAAAQPGHQQFLAYPFGAVAGRFVSTTKFTATKP